MDCPNFETCEGELTFRVFATGDGDPHAPWTLRTWTEAECTGQTCSCEFDSATWGRLEKDAIAEEEASEPII